MSGFAVSAPGSAFSPAMSRQALVFEFTAEMCREHLNHIGDLISVCGATDHETIDAADCERLTLVLQALREASRHMQEVERNRVV